MLPRKKDARSNCAGDQICQTMVAIQNALVSKCDIKEIPKGQLV